MAESKQTPLEWAREIVSDISDNAIRIYKAETSEEQQSLLKQEEEFEHLLSTVKYHEEAFFSLNKIVFDKEP